MNAEGIPKQNLESYPGYIDPVLLNGEKSYWSSNLRRLGDINTEIGPKNFSIISITGSVVIE